MSTVPTDTRPHIALLSDALVDQIAAGEVVERPASVVKELVENSLDAYGTEIDVEIKRGGAEHIRVTDNGIGMDRESALLALRRHATSKIHSAEDLLRVTTLGFRGEALPSIASVSRMTLTTRTVDEAEGTHVQVAGGRVESVAMVGAPVGTTVTVDDLFYNTPARKKFMKATATESRRVSEWMTDIAIGRPEIGFRYRNETRELVNVAPASDHLSRIADILGAPLAKSLLEVDNHLDYVEVAGYIGRPDLAKTHRGQIFLYVNGRRIQDRSLVHALVAGYGEYLPQGRYPVAVIFIAMPPDTVDVNVHPTKAEVRFMQPRMIHDALYYTTNRALLSNRTVPSMAPGAPRKAVPTPDEPQWGGSIRDAVASVLGQKPQEVKEQQTLLRELYRPVPLEQGIGASVARTAHEPGTVVQEVMAANPSAVGTTQDVSGYEATGVFYQFANLYIVAPVKDALIVMDQHTAHERILYEAVADRINADLTITQSLLFPISLELDPQTYETFEQNQDLLPRTGFQVRPFGHRTVLIEGAPAVLRGKAPERYFREVLDEFMTELRKGRDRLSAMAASFACKAAVKAGDVLNEAEMAGLFDQLFATRNPYSCPHGRPTVVRIPREELDKKFGRA
jgi:DNA mismatch repair protein MutL